MKQPWTGTNRCAVLLAAGIAFSLLASCRSLPRLPGQWLDLPARPQGPLEDFSRRITSQLFENGMMIGVGNDERNLYVFFTPDIRGTRREPGSVRLSLWVDARGGKARRLGLEHVSKAPLRAIPPGGPPGNSSPGAPAREGDRDDKARPPGGANPREGTSAPRPAQALLKVIGPEKDKETLIAADGSQGPVVRLASDWGDFSYQLRLPIRGSGAWPGLDIRPGQTFAIGLSWEIDIPRGDDKGRMKRPPGGPGGSRRSGGGPGMGVEHGGMPGEPPASKRKVWVKAVLAEK